MDSFLGESLLFRTVLVRFRVLVNLFENFRSYKPCGLDDLPVLGSIPTHFPERTSFTRPTYFFTVFRDIPVSWATCRFESQSSYKSTIWRMSVMFFTSRPTSLDLAIGWNSSSGGSKSDWRFRVYGSKLDWRKQPWHGKKENNLIARLSYPPL